MNIINKVLLIGLCGAFLPINILTAQSPKPDEIEKVNEALPSKATVQPKKARKILVFNLTRGFKHDSIPIGAKTLELMGQKTGAFTVDVSEDISMFEQENLEKYDAIVFNNTTGELFTPPNYKNMSVDEKKSADERSKLLKANLLNFVSSGKGIIGIHAATDCFYNWREFGQMMGGYFNGHPWGKVIVKIDDPNHPINKAFNKQGFEISDEIYTYKDPYSRENLRVLLSVDWEQSVQKLNLKGGNRQDNDYALSWIRNYDNGRVFYCAFGHRHDIFWNKQILQHLLDGIQFALGDLKADATPSAKIKN